LSHIVETGTYLDARLTAVLIENIFVPNSPLHDGALIVNGGRIVAAGCFLPLAANTQVSQELGTRHRAAIGMTETTDALVIIVSEETGVISVAEAGRLARYLDAQMLRQEIGKVYGRQGSGRINGFMRRRKHAQEKR
jgi:diadenylate cyclase